MFKTFIKFIFLFSLLFSIKIFSQTIEQQIMVDQFGYRTDDPSKFAVFANPQSGQNSGNSYTPGSTFKIKRVSDNVEVFSGNIVSWNNGATHSDSGDKCWYADFSSLNTPGDYYVLDVVNNKRSFTFTISDSVYANVMKAAVRSYYYQRCGCEITTTHGGNWNHPICHNQDHNAQLYNGSPQGQTRDVSGGWHDAGDYNKYVTFLVTTVWELLCAYELNPSAFPDNWNIPESGNGIPDILDEIKYELDWLLKMQFDNGSVASRVIAQDRDVFPQDHTDPRYYTLPSSWATAVAAGLFAHASRTFQSFNASYASTLRQAAEKAWTWLEANPNLTPSNGYDGGQNINTRGHYYTSNQDKRFRMFAAAELFKTTGTTKYNTYFLNNFNDTSGQKEGSFHPLLNNKLDPSLCVELNQAYIVYAQTTGADSTTINKIKTMLKNGAQDLINNKNNDPYRGFMWTGHYCWGSNGLKARWAHLAIFAKKLGVDPTLDSEYMKLAGDYIHYFHGINPLNFVYLTSMGSKGANAGAERSVMEIYHGWFKDGSIYDGSSSTYGPAPGFVVGGPNGNYYNDTIASGGTPVTPPANNPPMKSYRDWNTIWPDCSWSVTEPAIYYQSAYVLALSPFVSLGSSGGTTEIRIYTDSETKITGTWSGNGTLVEETGNPYEGNKNYKYSYSLNNWWDGFGFNLDNWGSGSGLDFSGMQNLSLAYKGLSTGHSATIKLVDKNGITGAEISLGTSSGSYIVKSISLSELKGSTTLDLTKIKEIQISIGGSQTGTGVIYIDDIKVTGTVNQAPSCTLTEPGEGWSYTAPATIWIKATATDSDGSITKVEFYNGQTKIGEDTTSPYEFGWAGVQAGSYVLSAKAIDDKGASTSSGSVTVTVTALPSPWKSSNIGNVGIKGSVSYASEKFTITGSGTNIGGKRDAFNFMWQTISGNCTIICRVISQSNTNPAAKAGIMIRENLAANSKHASIVITPANGIIFLRRTSNDGSTYSTTSSGKTAPYWLKLIREGNVFRAYFSANGTNWTKLGSDISISMNSTVYVGLVVTSCDNKKLGKAIFDNVTVSPSILAGFVNVSDEDVRNEDFLFDTKVSPLILDRNKNSTMAIYSACKGKIRFEIFSITGEKIQTLESIDGFSEWNGFDYRGRPVSSGIFILITKCDGKLVGKPVKIGVR